MRASCERPTESVVQFPAVPHVELVSNDAMSVPAFVAARQSGQSSVETVGRWKRDLIRRTIDIEQVAQRFGGVDHRHRVAVDDARLLLVRRGRIDLSPGFAVGGQHV